MANLYAILSRGNRLRNRGGGGTIDPDPDCNQNFLAGCLPMNLVQGGPPPPTGDLLPTYLSMDLTD